MERQAPDQTRRVITAFLTCRGLMLLLRRSSRVGSYPGRWAAVSGAIPEGIEPYHQALTEIEEETGLSADAIELVREGRPITVDDPAIGVRWVVHPFHFEVAGPPEIVLDWEHDEARWLPSEELGRLDTVPDLEEAWRRVTG